MHTPTTVGAATTAAAIIAAVTAEHIGVDMDTAVVEHTAAAEHVAQFVVAAVVPAAADAGNLLAT